MIDILELVVDILTIGVGILGVVGMTITGIQYLTADNNKAKIDKTKRRMFEIMIGLAVYAITFGLFKLLLLIFRL